VGSRYKLGYGTLLKKKREGGSVCRSYRKEKHQNGRRGCRQTGEKDPNRRVDNEKSKGACSFL